MRHLKFLAFMIVTAVSIPAVTQVVTAEDTPTGPIIEAPGPSDEDTQGLPVGDAPDLVPGDTDGDGLADTFRAEGKSMNYGRGKRFIDEDGDGLCDNHATGGNAKTKGFRERRGFIDQDGDGVCDNQGTVRGLKRGHIGGLREANFIDRDGDGVCDNMGKGFQKNRGSKIRTVPGPAQ